MVSITRSLGLVIAAATAFCVTSIQATNSTTSYYNVKESTGFQECAEAPSTPQDRRLDTSKLKFATYNAEFLYLVGYGGLKCPGKDCKWKSVSDARRHIKAVAEAIKAIDADIVQMNEVEDCALLQAVIDELSALGDSTYKPYLVRGSDVATGQNAALITRVDPIVNLVRSEEKVSLPVAGSTCPRASRFAKSKGVSKHFYTTFKVSGFTKPITVIGAHLLANPQNKGRCYEREGQATVLAGLAQRALDAGNHAIMSGDLNDFSRSMQDLNNNVPISNTLGIMEGKNFFNVGNLAPKAERYTQWWDRNRDCIVDPRELSTLDHIIVSNSLKAGVTNVAYRNDLYKTSCDGFNSDHYPITITMTPV